MSPPVWFELSTITGDPRYRDYANELYWETADYLFDDDAGLFLRDSRFFAKRDETGGKIFWSCGNGWVFYGLTRIIDTLAAESPLRPPYIGLYRQMAEALLPLQRANGFWPVSLLDPVPEQVRESSGTAFFVAGLAWGINQGILQQGRFDDAVLRGWNGLVSVVDEDGKLGWVQQVGYAPDEVKAGYTQLYGVGAFLMAASQVLDMGRQCPVIINNRLLPH